MHKLEPRGLETQQAAARAEHVDYTASGAGRFPGECEVRCSTAWAAPEGPLTSAVRRLQLVDSPPPPSWIPYSCGGGLLLARHGSCVAQMLHPQSHPQSRASLLTCRAPKSRSPAGAAKPAPAVLANFVGVRGTLRNFQGGLGAERGGFRGRDTHLWSHVVSASSSRVISSACFWPGGSPSLLFPRHRSRTPCCTLSPSLHPCGGKLPRQVRAA